jgi:nitrous oxide reductase accessory protein NosL
MRRRDLLSVLAAGTAGLAGCSLAGDSEPTETVTPAEIPAADRTPIGGRTTTTGGPPDQSHRFEEWVSNRNSPVLTDFETSQRTLALAPLGFDTRDGLTFAVRIAGTATADRPARMQALLYNANSFEKTVRLGRFPLLGRTIPTGRYRNPVSGARAPDALDGRLVLVPTSNHELVDRTVPVERGPDGTWHADLHPGDYPQGGRVTISPSGGVLAEYAVTSGRSEGPLVPGRYAFAGSTVTDAPDPLLPVVATVWPTDEPGPQIASAFDPSVDPQFERGESVTWFHQADRSAERYLLPQVEALDLPAQLTARLVNRTDEWYAGSPSLYKRDGGRWHDLGMWGPAERYLVARTERRIEPQDVQPTGIARFRLSLSHGHPANPATGIGYLGGGRYAFVVDVPQADERHGALLDIKAPEVTAWPEHGVAVARDGATVTVTDPLVQDGADAALTVVAERVDADPTTYVIDEQVMGRYGAAVRNTLTVFEDGVETVRYHSADSVRTVSFARLREQTVRFDDVTARLSVERSGATA